jgi:hypothetical protein
MPVPRTQKTAETIESRSMPVTECGCWIWLEGTFGRMGYGRISYGGKSCPAHRLSWEVFRGPIPRGGHVLHKCDTPLCVNPDHLFLGDHYANMRDREKKGRARRCYGEKHSFAKLTEEDVKEIRATPRHTKGVAAKFGVSHGTLSDIRLGQLWKHV